MIPERGSLFLCDWSKIEEKHNVKKRGRHIKDHIRKTHMVTVRCLFFFITYIAAEEEM